MDDYVSPPPISETAPAMLEPDKDARLWGMLCHLSALAGYAVPLGNIIGPLIVWQIKKNDYPFVDDQGKESLNFQISILIYLLVSIVLTVVSCGILFPLPLGIAIAALVFLILAGIKANNGETYRYPLTIRFIK